jgi:predicted dehydrogenase
MLDDDVDVIHQLSNGGGGLTSASQIACGHWNDHGLDVYGSYGSIRWRQEQPQILRVVVGDGPEIVYTRGASMGLDLLDNDKMRAACGAKNVDRLKEMLTPLGRFVHLPSGHGEDFFEALGNNHAEFGACVDAWRQNGKTAIPAGFDYPTVLDGLRGMAFLAACKANRDGKAKFTQVQLWQ